MAIGYVISWILLTLIMMLVGGTLLNLSSYPHWFIRGWDFPRVQIIAIAWIVVVLYGVLRYVAGPSSVLPTWPFLVLAVGLTAWHSFLIYPYTPLMSKQAANTPARLMQPVGEDPSAIRTVMTNVEMENDQYETWMQTMRAADPDLLLVVEVDEKWIREIKSFTDKYPYQVIEPRDNWYGMMLLSRLPIEEHRILHLVQDDVPSIDARIRMDDGTLLRFVGVHPRPPEPIRDNDAKARDAELTLWGTELAEDDGPIIIGGDLNDVAWSQTTRLFLRTSGLLDPRRGRGFFNTFHADHWYMRFPLDHIFHSPHFTISNIERMGFVGSDHFPMLIDLRYTPTKAPQQEPMEEKPEDEEEVEMRIDRAIEDQDLQGEAVDEGVRETIEDVEEEKPATKR
ncbi:endonuclease/exonuclease/phosphatase family protein [Roseimaritima ulvae]|uniref:Endonuclease/Exonuclease/phosphatase family protein n=1 Tax=Roseimaritima ulvae TaxID=980254 RepID=A0A5B9QPW0_9BACT|nr:endonuclease/exonuclease/phosphatase family protein [Roseimaritima ulvae]QEG41004.1 Endonuclease/Exonuclease/phosphatase family protein [Roseimaritima ulvae]